MKAISIDPLFVDAWNARGYVLYILGMYKKAIICFNKAIEICPENLYYLALDIVVCLPGVPEKKISRQHRYILLNYNVK